jgi:protein-disulfide isomerase
MKTPASLPFLLFCAALLACGVPPAPFPTSPTATVAIAEAQPPSVAEQTVAEPAEESDPGPVPVTAEDPIRGNPDAKVTIVEFADFQCPFCSRAEATLAQIRQRYKPNDVRIVWKNLPLAFHTLAEPAAGAAAVVFVRRGNDAFWQMHDFFYQNQSRLEEAGREIPQRFGVTPGDMDDPATKRAVMTKLEKDKALADRIGAKGTPTFFINGVLLSGAQPYDKFAGIIDEQLAKANALIALGTPPPRVYAALATAQFKQDSRSAAPETPSVDLLVYRVPVGTSPVRGNAAALVTMVEISDFQCPFCARVTPTVRQLEALYGDRIRVVFKHNPLPFHPRAEPAAELAIEAREQKGEAAFWKAHDALFANQTHLDDADLESLAKALGLDAPRVMKAIATYKHKAEIEADQELADDVGASGTPHFFINGRRLVGAQPIEKFKELIDEELVKAEAMVKAGTPAAKVYDTLEAHAVTAPPPEQKTIAAPTKDNPSRGPANAKVVVQMFSDFQCPFCKRVNPTIDALERAFPGKIRVVWRNMPLPFHKQARPAAEAAMEAFEQKGSAGFWAMHALIFAGQEQQGLERPGLDAAAAKLGLDMGKFAQALDQQTHEAAIAADVKIASDAGITGTPAFVINGYFVSGAQPLSKFRKIVARALAEAK